eukprot:TRINITY_DN16982_c0_g1_i1.p1 TRINITY_DN16982_c0_g1~~TRINITY_DN16982_c0_g1_i1.p1  ORF type:complete len:861 (+),score=94.03 TRINITY_DN16982_c0_g1_i1:184-2583(+)
MRGFGVVAVGVGDECGSVNGRSTKVGEEVEAYSGRTAVVVDSPPNGKGEGKLEKAFSLPMNPSVHFLLQSSIDHHLITDEKQTAIAVTPDQQLHILNFSNLPFVSLTLPSYCSPPNKGISSWHGAGLGASTWSDVELRGGKFLSVHDVAEMKITAADIAPQREAKKGVLRTAGVVETAQRNLKAIDGMLCSLNINSYNFEEVEETMKNLRRKLTEDDDSVYEALSSMQSPLIAEGVAGVLPFSIVSPPNLPAVGYAPTTPTFIPVKTVPGEIFLLVHNPSSQVTDSGSIVYFFVKTDTATQLSASVRNGVCEPVGNNDDGSADSEAEDGDDAPISLQREHHFGCVLDSLSPMETRNVSVHLTPESKPVLSSVTSADSTLPEISKMCVHMVYLGNGRVRITTNKLDPERKTETVLRFYLAEPKANREKPGLTQAAALRGIALCSLVSILVHYFLPSKQYFPSQRVLACVVSLLFIGIPLQLRESSILLVYAPLTIVLTIISSVWCSMTMFSFTILLRILPTILIGPRMVAPMWDSVYAQHDYTVEVQVGRIADDMIIQYPPYNVKTTLTAYSGKSCVSEIEHWSEHDGGIEVKIVVEGAGSEPLAVTSHTQKSGARVFRYEPYTGETANRVMANGLKLPDISLKIQPEVPLSIVPYWNDAVLGVVLYDGEGFYTTLSESDSGVPEKLIALLPSNSVGKEGLNLNTTLLLPPRPLLLERVRYLSSAVLLLTYYNPGSDVVSVSARSVCSLPICLEGVLRVADHLGHVNCQAPLYPVHQLPRKTYSSFVISRSDAACAEVKK